MGYPVPCSQATIYKCLLMSNVIFCTLLKSKIHNDNLWFIYLLCWYGLPILLVFKASLIKGDGLMSLVSTGDTKLVSMITSNVEVEIRPHD